MPGHSGPAMQNEVWYKNAVIYELHVRSFHDSDGDGVGDFRGLTSKLDYLQDLGVTAIWLLPFYPSPLRDDGYDIADYYSVNPAYGSLDDFEEFLVEAHRRKLRVITELVINHTSDQHPWFQRARQAPHGSSERDFYVWSDTQERFREARIIFKDFESSNWAWDPVSRSYYWHRFYSHQPDLNFDNPEVRAAVFDVLDFWFAKGVDGLRLDAVPYLFERDGTSCENLPETHGFLRDLRRHIDRKFPGRMLLAEANQWPEDAVGYFGSGDECHMAFHFPLMPRLFMGIQMEDRFPIIDILEQTPQIPGNCQWATFLRNHDELTLEMVTDEERDYMYRLYARDPQARINLGIRRRLAPLMDNNRRKIELINSLLLSLPGTPIIYYGDEIGMGDNFYLGDRNGVRTPMQWSADRNAGFSAANPQRLFLPVTIDPEFHYEAVNVEVQQKNLSSLFWWMRRIIEIRKKHPALCSGEIEFLRPANSKVLAFLRRHERETILVVANLSRFSQSLTVEVPGEWKTVELFGGQSFGESVAGTMPVTIGPHGFYWLKLESTVAEAVVYPSGSGEIPFSGEWSDEVLEALQENILPAYLMGARWFGFKDRGVRKVRIRSNVQDLSTALRFLLLEVTLAGDEEMIFVLPVAIGSEVEGDTGATPIARFLGGAVLWDAIYVSSLRERLWQIIAGEESVGNRGEFTITGVNAAEVDLAPEPGRVLGGEQSNSTIAFGDVALLKFIRRLQPGPNPDRDIVRALGNAGFPHVPQFLGELRCRVAGSDALCGLLTAFVPNQGDGWNYTLDEIARFFERVMAAEFGVATEEFAIVAGQEYPERARQLGERTGQLHLALESLRGSDFVPEPFTPFYQRSMYQSMRTLLRRTEADLARRMLSFAPGLKTQVEDWLAAAPAILACYTRLLEARIGISKIRVHGDFHLGQVLNTGADFVILDFEGEPRRSLGERIVKRPAPVDVAGMLRSFDYAIEVALRSEQESDRPRLRPWADRWLELVSRRFLDGYLSAAGGAAFLPTVPGQFELMLKALLLDKAVYEVGYELSYRPDYLPIPLAAVGRILRDSEGAQH